MVGRALSGRERQAVALLADGYSPKAAAHKMGVSPNTIREYLDRARVKFGAETLPQLCVIVSRISGHDDAETAG